MNQHQKSGPCSSTFCIDNYYCCACSKTSININKYVQKAGEPENYAGFLKHNSQLNCSYSYPSKPRVVVTVFRVHIYGLSKWFNNLEPMKLEGRQGASNHVQRHLILSGYDTFLIWTYPQVGNLPLWSLRVRVKQAQHTARRRVPSASCFSARDSNLYGMPDATKIL